MESKEKVGLLESSLEDIIKEKKAKNPRRRNKTPKEKTPRKRGRSPPARREASSSKNAVFVGNLAYSTTWQILKDHMRGVGEVLHADVFQDSKGRSKGCGLVEFASGNAARRAIRELNETKLDGRSIFVRQDDIAMSKHEKEHSAADRKDGHSNDRGKRSNKTAGTTVSRGGKSIDHLLRKDRRRETVREFVEAKSRSRSRSRSKSNKRDGNSNSSTRKESPEIIKESTSQRKNYRIVIENLPNDIKLHLLTDAFKDFGNILNSSLEFDDQGKKLKYGVIQYDKQRDAEKAIKSMNNTIFGGMKLSIRKDFTS